MKWRHSIPLAVVLVVGLAAAALVLVAMFITDQGEESLHLYRELTAGRGSSSSSPGNGMELQGRWLGMSLAAADSESARAVGVREAESGVVVVDLASQGSERARAAGLSVGDRITAIDGKAVRNMGDLYTVSRSLSPAAPALVEVRRGELPMTLVLPAVAQAIPGARPELEGAGLPAAWVGGHFFCPRENIVLPPASVGPGLRCPRCQSPVQPYARAW